MMDTARSDLGPMGFTHTHINGYKWAEEQVLSIREALSDSSGTVQGHMWTYRHGGCEMLAIHVTCDDESIYGGTITANSGEYEVELSGDEAFVPDIVEAVHLAGIIFQSLEIPVRIGRLVNETNECLVDKPFRKGQTNAHIRLIK